MLTETCIYHSSRWNELVTRGWITTHVEPLFQGVYVAHLIWEARTW